MFPIAQQHISEVVLVSDDAIQDAQESLWKTLRIATEPGGAAAFAALLSRRYKPKSGRAGRSFVLRGEHHGGELRATNCRRLLLPEF